ncbi:MAG: tetratricopeptide repeat protein, partial [Saprospiraceae bacterium]|nr:tetratricopeptide repeat protein [Saprospiraceae bacterium]
MTHCTMGYCIKTFYVLALTSLILPFALKSQNAYLDSLAQVVQTDVPDSVKMKAYSQLIWPNTKINTNYALELTADMMKIARRSDRERWLRQAQYYYAVTYKNTAEFSKALPYIDSVYFQSEAVKDTTFMAYASYQKAVILKEMGLYEEAIEWANINIAQYRYIQNQASVAMALNAKAGLYRQMKLYSKAIETYQEAYEIYLEQQDSVGLANLYNNLGNVYSEIDSFDLALVFYNKQEEININLNDVSGQGYCYENRGRLFHRMGRYEDAIASLRKSIDIRRDLNQNLVLANSLFQLGSSLQKVGKIDEAEKHIQEGLFIADQNGMVDQLRQGYFVLSEIYGMKGNYKQAYDYHVKQAQLKDSILNSTISEQALRIDALTDYENKEREQKIALLAAQNEIQRLRLNRSRSILLIALLGITALTVLSIWIYRSRKKKKKLYQQL